MEVQSLIKTGNKLELQRIRHVRYSDPPVYVSRFLYKRGENEAVIDMPIYQGRLITLSPGESYFVTFYTEKGLYKCRVEVTGRFREDGFPVAVVSFLSAFEKLQRRQYYRMECLLPLNFRVVTMEEAQKLASKKMLPKEDNKEQEETEQGETGEEETGEEGKELPEVYEGVTLDLSGGGIRFNASDPAEEGQIVFLQVAFDTPMLEPLSGLFAKILTVTPVQNKTDLYEHRAEFILISNGERERIIRYIFLEERNRRKKNV